MMSDEQGFISGIHNYCDRWCEQCRFRARCGAAEAESRMTDEERDIENAAFRRNLANIFAEAQTMLAGKTLALGIEIAPTSDADYAEYREREDDFVQNQTLTRLAEKYREEARLTLGAQNEWLIFSPLDEIAQTEMLSILDWYIFFIAAKIRRGFHSLLDYDGSFLQEELDDAQSDANGSIKIALIAVTRSIIAWTNLMSPENSSIINPHIALLNRIKQTAETKFPNAKDFVRPGFDEIETAM